MEQKTEASQAVDEKAALVAVGEKMAKWLAALARSPLAYDSWIDTCRDLSMQWDAALKAQPAPTEAHGDPVMWFEAEASAKGQPLRHVVGSMLFSTRMHTTKPEVLNNALWPLYEHPAATAAQGEDSARLDAGCDCDSPEWCKNYNRCHRQVCGFELRGTTPKPV